MLGIIPGVGGDGQVEGSYLQDDVERREFFEEAAGITFHRKKRAETLDRLGL